MPDSSWVILLVWASVFGDGPVPDSLEMMPGAREAARLVGISQEWVLPSECSECSLSIEDVRIRGRVLASMPQVRVLEAYPSEEWLDAQVRFANGHIEWLRTQQELNPLRAHEWDEWIAEAQVLRTVYSDLSYARYHLRSGNHTMFEVRARLQDVADRIGRDGLERGYLPPLVPVWRFQRAR